MKNNKLTTNNRLIKKTFLTSHKDYLLLGVSGGIDSAVCLAMLIKLFGKNKIIPYYLPIGQSNNTNEIELLSQVYDINISTFDLSDLHNEMVKKLNLVNEDNINNLKPKIRALFLSVLAFEKNGLVVSCLNYDEYYLGYFTKNGDSAGDIFPLINFCKHEIYSLAHEYKIPEAIINKKPSADLYLGQLDEQELGLTYEEIDNYLQYKKVSKKVIDKIKLLKAKNEHKQVLNKYLFKNNLRNL